MQPVSMHAEMHAIYNVTGMTPSFKTQVQGMERRVSPDTKPQSNTTKGSKGASALESCLSGPIDAVALCQLEHEDEYAFSAQL